MFHVKHLSLIYALMELLKGMVLLTIKAKENKILYEAICNYAVYHINLLSGMT